MTIKCPKCQAENPETKQFCGDCGTQLPSSRDIHPEVTETLQTPIKELTTGSTFAGRYQIIEELGKGGMGRVYRAVDKKLNEEVAIKIIKPEIALDKSTLARFQNELKVARKISHRNVGRMYELMEDQGLHFITMEYVPGEDLRSFLHRSKRLTVGTAVAIAKDVCEGLAEAHRLGVIHRDLKPSNIIIDKEGNARIMDFGIARSLRTKRITGEGVIIGTPEYMSPEQVEGKEADQRSDIYALGVILYEMLTGRVPFEGDTPLAIAVKHKTEVPRDPKLVNAQIPDDLSRVVLKCLEKDKEKRYQSADALHLELEKIEKGIPTTERVMTGRKPFTSKEITVKFSLKKLLWPGLSIVVLAILAVVLWRAFAMKKASPAPEKSQAKIVGLPESKNSIAVLPFKNTSPEQGQDYFCDGMTDELIAKLSKVQSLRVISRNSIFTFKNTPKSTKAIAQELQVKNILDGSVRKAGNRLRIFVQLIDAETDAPIWSDTYDKNLENIFDLQDSVAQAIVNALQLKLTPEETKAIAERAIKDPYAYECYLRARKGIYSASSFSKEGLDLAYQEVEKALNAIGDNVLLYSTLGSIYYQYVNRGINREEYLRKAEETAAKIFLLEPDSPYGHKLLGLIQMRLGKAKEAARQLKKALISNPNDMEALSQLIFIYEQAGHISEAVQGKEKLSQIDPVSNPPGKLGPYFYLMDGQFELALKTFEKPPATLLGQLFGIWTLALTHRLKEAVEKTDKLVAGIAGLGPEMDYGRDFILFFKYGLQGKKEKALAFATDKLKKICQTDEQLSWMLADCYSLVGEKKEAINWLEIAVSRGFVNYPFISKYDPFLKNIGGEERFKKLMERVKYEWEHFLE